ncbi:hypothetical protein WN55_09697 [Dufourea novaeangliae]|uniref:Uncharacterized protein n=1 Tax=Dufourea novaeangliae TaxID=178035 RepID=A0A154P0X7_DUFNO|nr:hypothetical protein WN55_09697 [Dufourea novaeangliae]
MKQRTRLPKDQFTNVIRVDKARPEPPAPQPQKKKIETSRHDNALEGEERGRWNPNRAFFVVTKQRARLIHGRAVALKVVLV